MQAMQKEKQMPPPIIRPHLVQVQLPIGALVADPMHQLSAAKSGVLWMNAVLEVALTVPFK